MTEPLAVSIEQAAAVVGISKGLAEKLIARHQFPHVRLGDRVVVPLGALAQWLDERGLASVEDEDGHPPGPRVPVVEEAHGPRRRPRAV